jgi:hypothetical protein
MSSYSFNFDITFVNVKKFTPMKKLLLMCVVMLGFVGLSQAQTKACSKADKKACAKACAKTSKAAAKLASLDDSIEQKVCEKSGSVSYVRKSVCETSGNVSYESVEYDSMLGKFVNVSPAMEKKACTAKEMKACKKKSAKADKAKAKLTMNKES